MLRGRCACRTVAYEVADEFVAAFNCHCSNCRAMSGSAFLPWGEVERDKIRLIAAADAVLTVGDSDSAQAFACATCLSLLYWSVRGGVYVRVPYGTLVDAPALKPMAHIFVGSKASWYDILDDLPRHEAHP